MTFFAFCLVIFGVYLLVDGLEDVNACRFPIWRYLRVEGWKSVWLGIILMVVGIVWM